MNPLFELMEVDRDCGVVEVDILVLAFAGSVVRAEWRVQEALREW